MHSSAFISFLLLSAASAAPAPAGGIVPAVGGVLNSVFCLVNAVVVDLLIQNPAATSYCSSFLAIPTQTTSVTSTVGAGYLFTATVTSSVTAPTTATQVITQTVTPTSYVYTSTSSITCLSSAYTASTATAANLPIGLSIGLGFPTTYNSASISSACGCLYIPTPTVTVQLFQTGVGIGVVVTSLVPVATNTVTTTVTATSTSISTVNAATTATVTAAATKIVSNGIAYRRYTSNYNADSSNSGFTSSSFKSGSVASGYTLSLGFSTPGWPNGGTTMTLSDGASFDASQAALLLQGFFIAPSTGTYTFSSSGDYIDNWGYLWTGSNAYSAWNDGNTNFQASRTGAGYFSNQSSVVMNAGDAIPLAWLWANGGGVGQSNFVVTLPGGTTTGDTTGYFVQACSNNNPFT